MLGIARSGVVALTVVACAHLAAAGPATTQALPSPTLITLHVREAGLDEVLAELSKQAGYAIAKQDSRGWDAAMPALTIDADEAPLWQVLHDVFLQTHTGFAGQLVQSSDDIRIRPKFANVDDYGKFPASIHGPFMAVVTGLRRTTTLETGSGGPPQHELELVFEMLAEPRARVYSASWSATFDSAVDDHGNSLLRPRLAGGEGKSAPVAAAPPPAPPVRTPPNVLWTVRSPLQYPAANPGRKIVRISGTVRVYVLLPDEPRDVEAPGSAARSRPLAPPPGKTQQIDIPFEFTDLAMP